MPTATVELQKKLVSLLITVENPAQIMNSRILLLEIRPIMGVYARRSASHAQMNHTTFPEVSPTTTTAKQNGHRYKKKKAMVSYLV